MSGLAAWLAGAWLLAAGPAPAQVSSGELIEHAAQHSGQPVEYVGEVIGEPMIRGDHLWLNVSDGQNALGVWVAVRDLPPIRGYGSYEAHGDVVQVRGTFQRACPEHGGDLDIHAASIVVVQPGTTTTHETKDSSLVLAGLLLLTSVGSFVLWRRRERKVRTAQAAIESGPTDPQAP